jgi:hypothetical protein
VAPEPPTGNLIPAAPVNAYQNPKQCKMYTDSAQDCLMWKCFPIGILYTKMHVSIQTNNTFCSEKNNKAKTL